MSGVKRARMMFCAAERDFSTFQSMTAGMPAELFEFHMQQAVEKALKSRLASLCETYPLAHNLEALLDILASRDLATELFRELIEYTPHASEFGYEGIGSSVEPLYREEALAFIGVLVERSSSVWRR